MSVATVERYTSATRSTLPANLYISDREVKRVVDLLNEGRELRKLFNTTAEAFNFLIHEAVRDQVTYIDFTGFKLNRDQFKDIALNCSQVATLILSGSDLTSIDFSRFPALENLRTLNVSYCAVTSSNYLLLGRNIEKLNIAFCTAVNIEDLKPLRELSVGGISQLTTSFIQKIKTDKLTIVGASRFKPDISVDPKLGQFLSEYYTKTYASVAEKIKASGLQVKDLEIES